MTHRSTVAYFDLLGVDMTGCYMPELERFTFNGLRGSDLIIFNLLQAAQGRLQLSGYQIAKITCYHHETVYKSLSRLEQSKLIERRRDKRGQRYNYSVKN